MTSLERIFFIGTITFFATSLLFLAWGYMQTKAWITKTEILTEKNIQLKKDLLTCDEANRQLSVLLSGQILVSKLVPAEK